MQGVAALHGRHGWSGQVPAQRGDRAGQEPGGQLDAGDLAPGGRTVAALGAWLVFELRREALCFVSRSVVSRCRSGRMSAKWHRNNCGLLRDWTITRNRPASGPERICRTRHCWRRAVESRRPSQRRTASVRFRAPSFR
ncbi:hypothetical protein [Streptomyces sp. NBC_00199]|uniref:hypothetical protein n=1 Tax=Streptomyces sp. NBC_00199 TaxID=2975678 RepID=UPI002254DFF8|nr:hypothetical protein [Streptomyces sp. NBC_00199]MCX5267650.1 hypothetical protein [Streptomyces sp. NBC_00199]